MINEYPIMEVHELDEGRRYLSTRVGEGFDLVIFTTPISEASIEEHEELLDAKVEKHLAESIRKQRDALKPIDND